MAGLSAWEIRYRNAIKPGQVLPNGQFAGNDVELEACLLALKEVYEKAKAEGKYAGIACAFKNSGIGVGLSDVGRCILSVETDIQKTHGVTCGITYGVQSSIYVPLIHIKTSAACMGQGLATALTQIACEALGLPPEYFFVEPPDTAQTPDSGTTTASRQSLFTGEATRQAALKLKAALDKAQCAKGGKLEESLTTLLGQEFYGEYSGVTDPMGSGKPNPVSHVAYSYAATVAILDSEGRVEKLAAAYDIGRVINPKAAEGQVEGGLLMGMGYALTEDFPMEGVYPKATYGKLGLLRATNAPQMEVVFVEPKKRLPMAFGAKGVGELATIPVTPAIAGAYYDKDGRHRAKLPMEGTFYKF